MPGSKNLIILDLSEIKLTEITKEYPNLWRLAATGTTGVFNFTKSSGNDSIIHRIQNKRFVKGSAGLIAVNRPAATAGEPKNRFPGLSRKSCTQFNRPDLLRNYDRLVEQTLRETDLKTTLICGCFSWEGVKGAGLGAVVFKGLGFDKGVLYSPSTRKPGIITLNDLRYMVQQFSTPVAAASQNFKVKQFPGYWRSIAESQARLIQNYKIRWPVLTVYGYFLLGLLGTLAGGMVFRFHNYPITAIIWLYLFLLAVPGAFLLMAIIDPLNWTTIITYSLGITGGLFFLSFILAGKKLRPTLAWLSFLTAGLILIDGLWNGYYEYKSLLGYSAVSGARYHGIGNEYMGILLGAYIAGISLSLKKLNHWRREFLWTAALIICMILIHPSFGADVGGGISALMGLGITNYLWLGQAVRFREIGYLSMLTLLALAFAGIWDLFINQANMSHWGQLLLAIQNRGWEAFQTIAIRKLEMNLRLISTNPLALLLILILAAIPVLYRYSPVPIKRLKEKYPLLISGFTGLSITALVGFVVNDSGIVSAAMIFMFGTGLIALIINSELEI